MKVIKELDQGLLLNYYGFAGQCYLAVGILTFFSFENPDQPLKEQELWPFVQGEFGKDAILDLAMPKVRGEALVWGRCFAPAGKPVKAIDVSLQVGPIRKELYVFGNRCWKRAAGQAITISEPEPFVEMPLTYANAFGGPEFERNPLGKGIVPVSDKSGRSIHPLPNIEDPLRLVGSSGDRPDPAGFAPLDFTWRQRSRKLGTYDQKWMNERWPYYPDDMDWTYFNAAPEDQQLSDAYFRGDETFSLKNLHPGKPVVSSRLPGLRQRCFINQLADPKEQKSEPLFREVGTRAETVWLFPHAERGIVIFRGVARIADDEALDIKQIFVAAESLKDKPDTLENYYEIFKKRLERNVPAEIEARMAEAKEKIAEAKEHFKDLPLQINDAVDQGLGLAPRPQHTPQEMIAKGLAQIDKGRETLDMGEKRMIEAKAQFGHLMKIDPGRFTAARESLDKIKQSLQEFSVRIEKSMSEANGLREKARKGLQEKTGLDPAILKILKEKNIELPQIPPGPFEIPAEKLWHTNGMRFIERCRENLESNPDAINSIRGLGLRPYMIKRSWLGLNPEEAQFDAAQWGLDPDKDGDKIVIPPGLIIPCFVKADLIRITVRPGFPAAPNSWRIDPLRITDSSEDFIVKGSREEAMAIGPGDKPFLRVADEMEAILIFQEAGGACGIISMKTPDGKPDDECAEYLKSAPQFLAVKYPGSDPAEMESWKKINPESEWLAMPPEGVNLYDARRNGADLSKWVINALKPGIAPAIKEEPQYPENDPRSLVIPVPKIDVKALMDKVRGTVEKRAKPGREFLDAKKKEINGLARNEAAKRGLDFDALLKPPPGSFATASDPFAAAKENWRRRFAQSKDDAQKRGFLSAELEKKIDGAEKLTNRLADDASARYADGMAKLAAAKGQIAAGLPDWAKNICAQCGIDPDDPPLKNLTREEVIKRYSEGKSLEGKNLSEADLSGLDLRGINLRKAMLQKTNFSGAILDGADLTETIAEEADFSDASVKNAEMSKGLFQKAKLKNTNLTGSNLHQALLTEADMTGANLSGAVLEKALMEKAILVRTNLMDAKASKGYFLSADLSGADLSEADMTKAVFLKAKLDETDFSGSTVKGANFIESKGEKVSFAGADMFNARVIKESAFPNADFTNVKAAKSCWMNSEIPACDFRGSEISRGLIQECNLNGSNLSGIRAPQARFTKSDMSGVDMRGANLFGGSLRKSKIVKADLRDANLYGVEFFRTGVGDTKFDGANVKMTKLQGRVDLIPEQDKKKK